MSVMNTGGADFLSSRKITYCHVSQKKSVMQVLAANILMGISVVKTLCEYVSTMTGKLAVVSRSLWVKKLTKTP